MAKQVPVITAPNKVLNDSFYCLAQGLYGLLSKESTPTDYFNSIFWALNGIVAKTSGIKPEIVEIVNKLLSKCACSDCGSQSISTHFNCHHFLCEACTQKHFQKYNEQTLIPLYIECPICKAHHLQEEMYTKIPNTWPQIINSIKSTRIIKQLDKNCDRCEKQKNNDEFPENPACDNHLYCKECVAQKFIHGDFKCDKCETKIKIDPTDEKGFCTSCRREVYYVGDSLTTLCKDHTHCYNCLENAVENQMCMTCGLSLDNNLMTMAEYTIKGKCSLCLKNREKVLILVKQCCEFPICAFCQLVNPFNCSRCGSGLNNQSVSLVLHVRSVINNV